MNATIDQYRQTQAKIFYLFNLMEINPIDVKSGIINETGQVKGLTSFDLEFIEISVKLGFMPNFLRMPDPEEETVIPIMFGLTEHCQTILKSVLKYASTYTGWLCDLDLSDAPEVEDIGIKLGVADCYLN